MRIKRWICCGTFFLFSSLVLLGDAQAKGPTFTDPGDTDADFAFQGEYAGSISVAGETMQLCIHLVAQGKGEFRVVTFLGGLPGQANVEKVHESVGVRRGNAVVVDDERGKGECRDGVFSFEAKGVDAHGKLAKVHRKSPTMGKKAPQGAVVLFDGTSADAFQNGRMTEDGLLMSGCRSKKTFGSQAVHIEFRLPYQPENRGQGRGNSGIYLQGRYEVQMLDSFGLQGKHNECGGIYEVKDPDVNMCLPPLSWQTYDIDFTAASFDDGGKLVQPARISVRHNGVLVHEDVELPKDRSTRAAPLRPGPEPGPIYLQDHGNPVCYRNIWVVEK